MHLVLKSKKQTCLSQVDNVMCYLTVAALCCCRCLISAGNTHEQCCCYQLQHSSPTVMHLNEHLQWNPPLHLLYPLFFKTLSFSQFVSGQSISTSLQVLPFLRQHVTPEHQLFFKYPRAGQGAAAVQSSSRFVSDS